MTTPQEIVQRARRCLGRGAIYSLGKGGMDPAAPFPWGDSLECDCSGFSMWTAGLSRHQPSGWFDTSRIVADATGLGELFHQVAWEDGRPGDVVVYGDHDGHQGHIGVVSVAAPGGPSRVIHCSLGNWRSFRDAVQEAPPALWQMHGAIIARLRLIELA